MCPVFFIIHMTCSNRYRNNSRRIVRTETNHFSLTSLGFVVIHPAYSSRIEFHFPHPLTILPGMSVSFSQLASHNHPSRVFVSPTFAHLLTGCSSAKLSTITCVTQAGIYFQTSISRLGIALRSLQPLPVASNFVFDLGYRGLSSV